MAYKISPSGLNLLKDCPRCFWLDKHGVWKRPSTIFPSLPSGMDRILKEHFDRFRKEGTLPPEISDEDHCNDMTLFQDEKLLEEWRNNFKGVRWTDDEGNVFFGAVDNLLEHKGKLVVLDYKTRGFALKEDTTDGYKDQLDAYNFLLRKNGFRTEDFSFLLFYVPKEVLKTGEIIFDTHLKKIDVDVNNAQMLFDKAINTLQEECPEKSCEWCEGKEIS